MFSHVRLALRTLSKTPGFVVAAVLTLALGISMSTSAFSLANAFLLRTVPYQQPDRIVQILRTTPQTRNAPHAPGNAIDLRAAVTSYSALAFYYRDAASLAEPGQPAQQVSGVSASPGFFNVIAVQPSLGRGFTPDEERPDKGKVVILTHRAWMRRFGGDPAVINRSLRLDGDNYTIIGVLPEAFHARLLWGPAEFVRPLTLWPHFPTLRNNAWLNVIGRLKDGVSIAQAQSEAVTIASRLAQAYPKDLGTDSVRVADLNSTTIDDASRGILWMMVVLSSMVLLIACANLASLQLARAFGRTREYAVRSALGAGRRHLMTPLLVESVILALVGGGFGVLLAEWTNDLIGRNLVIGNEPGFNIPVDGSVLLFAVAASVVSGIAFGLAPAILASRTSASEALKEGSRGTTAGRSHQRFKSALIICELAAALVLVGVASSFGLATKKFMHRDVGWTADGLFAGYLALPWNRYTDDAHCRTFSRALLERLSAIPGVDQAVLSTDLPIYSFNERRNLIAEGQPEVARGREPLTQIASVSPEFFSALRLPVKRGQLFTAALKPEDPPAVVINETVARRMWPGEDPIGKRLRFQGDESWLQVIAVVGDARMAVNLSEPDTRMQIYRPLEQSPQHFLAIVLRTKASPATMASTVRQIVASLDADLPVSGSDDLSNQIASNLANLNLVIANIGSFAVMGLLISAIGLYGVISHLTAQRTRDIGVRMALGAQYGDIIAMILRQGGFLLALGLVLGVPLFLVVNVFVHRSMPELPLPGLWLLCANLAVLAVVTLVACWLPARRAANTSPVVALHGD